MPTVNDNLPGITREAIPQAAQPVVLGGASTTPGWPGGYVPNPTTFGERTLEELDRASAPMTIQPAVPKFRTMTSPFDPTAATEENAPAGAPAREFTSTATARTQARINFGALVDQGYDRPIPKRPSSTVQPHDIGDDFALIRQIQDQRRAARFPHVRADGTHIGPPLVDWEFMGPPPQVPQGLFAGPAERLGGATPAAADIPVPMDDVEFQDAVEIPPTQDSLPELERIEDPIFDDERPPPVELWRQGLAARLQDGGQAGDPPLAQRTPQQQMEIAARDRGDPMPFTGESRINRAEGFTRRNLADGRWYATPTIFNPANLRNTLGPDHWRNIVETRERDERLVLEQMALPYTQRILQHTPSLLHDMSEFACSLCQRDLQEGDMAVRLSCTHVFHANCLNNQVHHRLNTQLGNIRSALNFARESMAGGNPTNMGAHVLTPRDECPNCRADTPQVVAIWRYQTQRRPQTDTSNQPNLLSVGRISANAMIAGMSTPRSMVTELDFGTPASATADPDALLTDESILLSEQTRPTGTMSSSQAGSNEDAYVTTCGSPTEYASWEGGLYRVRPGLPGHIQWEARMVSAETCAPKEVFLNNTELSDGRQALLIDPGSFNNLAGKPWFRQTCKMATTAGLQHEVSQRQRKVPLNVAGVGTGQQKCTFDCNSPIAMETIDGRLICGDYASPVLDDDNHALPALLGLKTLIELKAIIDFSKLTIAFCGPGDTRVEYPPGTDIFKLFQAPSGHLMLPCCEYDKNKAKDSLSVSLHSATASAGAEPTNGEPPERNVRPRAYWEQPICRSRQPTQLCFPDSPSPDGQLPEDRQFYPSIDESSSPEGKMSEGGDTLLLAPITEEEHGDFGGCSSPETIVSSPAEEKHPEASSSGPAKSE